MNEGRKEQDIVSGIAVDILQRTVQPSDFPVSVFPAGIQKMCYQYSANTGAPIDILGGAILSVAGTALGNAAMSRFGDYTISAIIFLCVVARRGTGKTHPLEFVMRPLTDIDSKAFSSYEKELAQWNNDNNESAKPKRVADAPAPPPQFIPTDTTYEAVVALHKTNKKGMLLFRDELTGFIDSFNQYSKGGDSQKYLQLFNGTKIIVARKSSTPIQIEHPHVSIIGGVQPEMLHKLAADSRVSDGFLDRFLFCYPEQCPAAPFGANITDATHWRECVKNIHGLNATVDTTTGEIHPINVVVSQKAADVLRDYDIVLRQIVDDAAKVESNTAYANVAGGIAAKLRTYMFRLALIINTIHWGCGEQQDIALITEESAARAVLLTKYFLSTGLKVHSNMSKEAKRQHNVALAHRLHEKGTNQRDIAERIGVSVGSVNAYLKEVPPKYRGA